MKLGRFEDLQARQSCRLCQFFVEAIFARSEYHHHTLQKSWCSLLISNASDVHNHWTKITLRFHSEATKEEIELLPARNESSTSACSFRKLDENSIDISTIRNWMDSCSKLHPICESNPSWFDSLNPPDFLLVIDVQENCLTRISFDTNFVALSYVWGKSSMPTTTRSTFPSLSVPGGLKSLTPAFPKTIIDAIHLTAQLNEKYLWIDSLCIVEDDDQERHNLFRTMHVVYGYASLVIVAAAGGNADTGLPGVLPHLRKLKQAYIQLDSDLHLAAALPELHDVLPNTIWSGRGWTFQEGFLARRKLIFTNNTVYFSCDAISCSEDRYFGSVDGLPSEEDIVPTWSHFQDRRWFYSETPLQTYWHVIQTYTKLQLTYEKDVLYALSGILEALSAEFETNFLFGLPERYFRSALLWQPTEPIKRRLTCDSQNQPFPSWSWAGWIGPVSAQSSVRDVYASQASPNQDVLLVARSHELQKQILAIPYAEPQLINSEIPEGLKRGVGKICYDDPNWFQEHYWMANKNIFRAPTIDWANIDVKGILHPIAQNSNKNSWSDFAIRSEIALARADNSHVEPTCARIECEAEGVQVNNAQPDQIVFSIFNSYQDGMDPLGKPFSTLHASQRMAQRSPYLKFRTLSATFSLDTFSDDAELLSMADKQSDGANLYSMQILALGTGGHGLIMPDEVEPSSVGSVVIHTLDPGIGKLSAAEFIIVSNARRPGESSTGLQSQRRLSLTDYSGAWTYDCMMICRKNGIAERLGLGSILESAWNEAKMKNLVFMEDIVLG